MRMPVPGKTEIAWSRSNQTNLVAECAYVNHAY
jgi:hypothetical protein